MAFTPLTFTKDWSVMDASDSKYFPTHESSEEQVRADMQNLYNQIRTWANNLAGTELANSANLGLGETISSIASATTVHGALSAICDLIAGISQGAIPDHSVTSTKLTRTSDAAGGAVAEENIQNDAVTADKIKDGEVDADKLADNCVTSAKLVSDSNGVNSAVGTDHIKTGAVTNAKIQDYSLTHSKLATTANPLGAAVDNSNIVDATIQAAKFNSAVYGTTAAALGTNSSAGSASTVSRSDHVHPFPAIANCTGTLALGKGGTGATTADAARTNLGVTAEGKLKIGSTEYTLQIGGTPQAGYITFVV